MTQGNPPNRTSDSEHRQPPTALLDTLDPRAPTAAEHHGIFVPCFGGVDGLGKADLSLRKGSC